MKATCVARQGGAGRGMSVSMILAVSPTESKLPTYARTFKCFVSHQVGQLSDLEISMAPASISRKLHYSFVLNMKKKG